jgi:hypothetical protein
VPPVPFIRWLRVFGERGEARIFGTIELKTAAVLSIGSVVPMASAKTAFEALRSGESGAVAMRQQVTRLDPTSRRIEFIVCIVKPRRHAESKPRSP